MYRKMSLVKIAAIFVAVATAHQVSGEHLHAVLAQSFGENPDTFPIPDSLPDGTTLKVDGSTSMRLTNQALENRFENQFPNINVELNASRTDEAFESLIDGDIDVLATGRPLTADEKAQGVVEVPLEQREKLAIILGPNNTFENELTFEQFAGIFRGEITNWSEIGGPNLPIRFVDRPDYSDTRRALSTYAVFESQPFETGATADPVADDETDTVIQALGNDGIGYAVVSQVLDRDDVRIIPMHQTLPDDPRYPYSQYRAFVYKEGASPAVLAFLGFATTAPGQEVIATAPAAAALTDTDPATTAESATASEPAATPESTTAPAPAATPEAATDVGANPADKGGFPFWLLPLLAIPLLGGLLWWLLAGGTAPAAAPVAAPAVATKAVQPRIVLTPRDARNAYAYWEIPQERLVETKHQGGETMMVRIYDVTGRKKDAPLPSPTAEFPCIESNPDLHLPIAVDDRSYCAEIGYLTNDHRWLPIAKSAPVRVPVGFKGLTEAVAKAPAANTPDTTSATGIGGTALGGAALAGAAATAAAIGATKWAVGDKDKLSDQDTPDTTAGSSNQGSIQTVNVHSRTNAVMFDESQLHHIEHSVASTYQLVPSIYTLRLRDGVFNYDADDSHPGEPFVLLWIHGGTIISQKTGVPVSSTWTTLNGYEDTLTLDVREPATLCAFFVDTYPDDNSGEVTLSVTKH